MRDPCELNTVYAGADLGFFRGEFRAKIAFFSARAPLSKLVYFGTEGAFRKI